jgi:hypothetical protein
LSLLKINPVFFEVALALFGIIFKWHYIIIIPLLY